MPDQDVVIKSVPAVRVAESTSWASGFEPQAISPVIGPLFAWAGVLLSLASLVVATREVLATDTTRALVICVIALGLPVTALFGLAE
jgi:hypothetical protein